MVKSKKTLMVRAGKEWWKQVGIEPPIKIELKLLTLVLIRTSLINH